MTAKRSRTRDQTSAAKRRREKKSVEVTWNDVDNDTIRSIIAFAEHVDGAVRFGRSRDRGVYSIGFYVGDEHFTEWVRGGDESSVAFRDLLHELYEDFEG